MRARLLLLVFAAMVPAFALVIDTAVGHWHHNEDEARGTTQRLARMVAVDQEKTLEASRTLLMGLAQSPDVWSPDPSATDSLLAGLLSLSPAYANLAVADTKGRIVFSARPHPVPVSVADRKWFQEVARAREFQVGGYEISPLSGQPDFVVAVPTVDGGGRLRGVVSAWIDLHWMNRVFASTGLPAGSAVLATDRDGVILARTPDAAYWVGRSAAGHPAYRAARTSEADGSIRAGSMDGVVRLWSYTPIHVEEKPAAYVAVGIPASLAFADARRTMARSLLLLLLATVFMAAVAWYAGDAMFVRRVKSLVGQTRTVAAGDLTVRTGSGGRDDELGLLERAFDDMAATLEARDRQTKEAEASLRLSEARYQRLFQATPLPACVYDVETLTILNINEAAVAAYGYSREEFLSMTLDQVFPESELPAVKVMLTNASSVASIYGEFTQVRKDGTVIDIESVSHGLQFAGRMVRLVLAVDVTERNRLQEQLLNSVQQLRSLAQRLQTAREDERTRVAREVHDELGQALTGLKLDVAALRSRATQQATPDGSAFLQRLDDMTHLIDGAVQTVRRIATELRPAILDTLGLVPALEWQARDFQLRTGIPCSFRSAFSDLPLSGDCATAVFRVFQEALTNVARHAEARHVTVRLDRIDGHLQLTVNDDGVGMPRSRMTADDRFGICGMQERAALFGGRVDIESTVGKGTAVSLTLPEQPAAPTEHVMSGQSEVSAPSVAE